MFQGTVLNIPKEVKADPDKKEFRTRSGYLPSESFKSLQASMLESGVIATGRALHFAADLVCSGGLTVFIQLIWDYAIQHVGIASPRVFVYLKKRVAEIDAMIAKYADDDLIKDEEFQTRVSELIYVLHECPRRSRLVWTKVGPETHRDGWLANVASAPETQALKKIYQHGSDLIALRTVGCEFLKAISEGSIEKALFWVKWTLEEEIKVRKENGGGLTSVQRGSANIKGKAKADVIYYFGDLCAEAYKDFAHRSMIRMHEEFQCLLDLFKGADPRFTGKHRKNILGLLVTILCEVPRWKVPAAPVLIKDPITLSRAIKQSVNFFKEVMINPKVSLVGKNIFKGGKISDTAKLKVIKLNGLEQHFDAYEKAMEDYMNH